MPNQLKDNQERVTYIEDSTIRTAIQMYALRNGVSAGAVIREATSDYLRKIDPTGEFRQLSKSLMDKKLPSDVEGISVPEKH